MSLMGFESRATPDANARLSWQLATLSSKCRCRVRDRRQAANITIHRPQWPQSRSSCIPALVFQESFVVVDRRMGGKNIDKRGQNRDSD
jgi:hypothetical protein